jgi:hypothetical protein
MMRSRYLGLFALLATLSGCGDRPVFGPPPDASRDAMALDGQVADGGRDAAVDAHVDAAAIDVGVADAGHDVGTSDVGTNDTGVDGGFDAGFDAGHDASMDAGSDAGHDASADAGSDAGRDAGMDAGSDAGRDGGSDAGRDAMRPDAAGDGGPHLGPAPVLLGSETDLTSAGAYVLIGKTGITNVIGSMISGGHLGVSPASASAITGFALILDSTGQFSSSVSVVPPARIYAADYAVPTPSNLTSAILSMQAAYADAAMRSLPDFLNLSSGHIGGLVLVPGLYSFGSSVDITAGLTFAGGPNDVWILQISGDVDLSSNILMTLVGGAQAQNIFWQVAGQVTMHSGSELEGIILCSTGITMQTGASLHGRALAQTLVALDNNNIVAP